MEKKREVEGKRREERDSPWLSPLATRLHLALELHEETQTQLLWSSCTTTHTSLRYTPCVSV